jgi:hypothetical protein
MPDSGWSDEEVDARISEHVGRVELQLDERLVALENSRSDIEAGTLEGFARLKGLLAALEARVKTLEVKP